MPPAPTYLKLISDLGPWGIQDLLRNTTASPPPPSSPLESFPQPLSQCLPSAPPRHPNMPLHCSRVGRRAAAGPLDRGTLTQAMHAALAGAWGGQAPWPTGGAVGMVHAGWRSKGPAARRLGQATPPDPCPGISLGTRRQMLCFLQLIQDRFRGDLRPSTFKVSPKKDHSIIPFCHRPCLQEAPSPSVTGHCHSFPPCVAALPTPFLPNQGGGRLSCQHPSGPCACPAVCRRPLALLLVSACPSVCECVPVPSQPLCRATTDP